MDYLLEIFVEEIIKHRRYEISAKAQIGAKGEYTRDPSVRLFKFDLLENREEKNGKDKIEYRREVIVNGADESRAEAAVEVVGSDEYSESEEEGDAVSQLNRNSVFLKISSRKVICKGIKVFPPVGDQRIKVIYVCGRIAEESLGVKIKAVQHSGKSGKEKERSDKDQLMLFGIEVVIKNIEEGDHQKQADVHFDIPGIIGARVVECGKDSRLQRIILTEISFLIYKRKRAGKNIDDKHLTDTQVIFFRYRLAAHQISRKQKEKRYAYHAVAADDRKDVHRLSVDRNVVKSRIQKEVHRNHQQKRQSPDYIKRNVAVFLSQDQILAFRRFLYHNYNIKEVIYQWGGRGIKCNNKKL